MPSHITIATPAPAPAPWPLQDRIAWAASLILTIVAYVGIMLAVSALRKIERQTRYGETAAQAAAESAKAALLIANMRRPRHGRLKPRRRRNVPGFLSPPSPRPASPTDSQSLPLTAATVPPESSRLPKRSPPLSMSRNCPPLPRLRSEPHAPVVPIILLPGESTGIKSFRRDDVKALCVTEERLRRVEDWEEKIYLYGTVVYQDLRSIDEKQRHETSWCCWYIHGRQRSGMVMAGPPQYNRHS